jgi:hypothetical protein
MSASLERRSLVREAHQGTQDALRRAMLRANDLDEIAAAAYVTDIRGSITAVAAGVDSRSDARTTTFYGRESFIKAMGQTPRRVFV